MMLGRTGFALIAAAAVLPSASSGAATVAAAEPPLLCQSVAFSRSAGFCGYVAAPEQGPPRLGLYISKDAGESWTEKTAAGIELVDGDGLGEIVVSPTFDEDGTVYVQVGRGLFVSEDEGATFTLVDPLAGSGLSWRNLMPFVEELGGATSLSFAFANDETSALIRPPLHQLVLGSPFSDRFFLVPPEAPLAEGARVVAVEVDSSNPQEPRGRTLVHACDVNLVCQEQLHVFPWAAIPMRAWLLPTIQGEPVLVVVTREFSQSRSTVWWSHDGGETFSDWSSVTRLVQRMPTGAQVQLGVTGTVGERLYLRVSRSMGVGPDDRREVTVPRDRIFSSTDGERWSLVAQSGGGKRAGAIPWTRFPISFDPGYVFLHPSGRLFALGGSSGVAGEYDGIYCSTDGGRSWSKLCNG